MACVCEQTNVYPCMSVCVCVHAHNVSTAALGQAWALVIASISQETKESTQARRADVMSV